MLVRTIGLSSGFPVAPAVFTIIGVLICLSEAFRRVQRNLANKKRLRQGRPAVTDPRPPWRAAYVAGIGACAAVAGIALM